MKVEQKRIRDDFTLSQFVKKLHYYAYLETVLLVSAYLLIGYLLNPKDICILNGQFPYILILLSIITLFHGFESGMLGIGIIALAMWYFYPSFNYVQFLTTLMMVLILSEFHYYWSKKIREAEADSEYRDIKLNELSRAFYTLKISHDQLEKNYVTKPMSLRNSIMHIKETGGDDEYKINNFLKFLEKSFNIGSGSIALKESGENFAIAARSEDASNSLDLNDQLIQKSMETNKPVFVSDDNIKQSRYLAVIPALQREKIVGLLLIEKMPFMSFNRENLTSIAILTEYFFNEIKKENILLEDDRLQAILDKEYRYEYFRLYELYKFNKIDSTTLVIKVDNELLATRMFETIDKLLRSLDIATLIKHKEVFFISILFPLGHRSVTTGFINRLLTNMNDIQEDQFEHITFGYGQIDLYDKYISNG
ncbi:hypothetical protein [Sulfurimonas sp. HSL-1716]|uniref:hypothetical protein n=1 Tax=Hydrocurvibacter sulfurireducens TaxID=3131937 RepID=UPI0031F75E83